MIKEFLTEIRGVPVYGVVAKANYLYNVVMENGDEISLPFITVSEKTFFEKSKKIFQHMTETIDAWHTDQKEGGRSDKGYAYIIEDQDNSNLFSFCVLNSPIKSLKIPF